MPTRRQAEVAARILSGELDVRDYLRDLPPKRRARGDARLLSAIVTAGSVTPTMLRVIALAADGFTTGDTAKVLGVTYASAQDARRRALRALNARNMAHAIALALRAGLIELARV